MAQKSATTEKIDWWGGRRINETVSPEKPASVRMAGPEDEDRLFDFLVALHRYNKFGWGYRYDPRIVLAQIEIGTRIDQAKRSDPSDGRRGIIGIVDGDDGKIAGSIGLFVSEAVWFTDIMALNELWLFVRPEARDRRRIERSLFAYKRWAHAHMKADLPDYAPGFKCFTGFMHDGPRFRLMNELWRRLSGGRQVGSLFVID